MALNKTQAIYQERGNNKNFDELFALHAEGKLKPEITKSYSLDQAVEAIKSLEDRTATGKVVIEIWKGVDPPFKIIRPIE